MKVINIDYWFVNAPYNVVFHETLSVVRFSTL